MAELPSGDTLDRSRLWSLEQFFLFYVGLEWIGEGFSAIACTPDFS